MPRRGTYVDNATNRRLGRVGMAYGSAVVSSSSGSRSNAGASNGGDHCDSSYTSSSYSSSSSPRTYVDNATNRSLGRVGRPVGSHVVSRDGTVTVSGASTTSSNRSSGGASGGGHGDSRYSSSSHSSSSSPRTYVDNAMNRRLGRVGRPVGSYVVSRDGTVTVSGASTTSSSRSSGGAMASGSGHGNSRYSSSSHSSSSSPRIYVDNAMNRSLGQVGRPVGSHVVSRDGTVTVSGASSSSSSKVYVDNPKNRSLDRVGLPHGTCVQHKDGTVTRLSSSSTDVTPKSLPPRTYKDNAYNRKCGRAGKPLGSHVFPAKTSSATGHNPRGRPRTQTKDLLRERDLEEILAMLEQLAVRDAQYQAALAAQYELQKSQVEEKWGKSGIASSTDHSVVSTKEVIPLSEIDLEKKIGEGGFGCVYAGLWKKTPIAYKKLIAQQITNRKKQQLVNEIKIFSRLYHPNIVKMFGVVAEQNSIGIVMEYLPMTLFHALFIEEVQFSCLQKKMLIKEVISAISYLHSSNIAHCDIKCQNVLLDSSKVVKVCDFGLSAIKNSTTSTTSASAAPGQGTPRYSAPEVLRGELLKLPGMKMADIYSLTLVIYQILVEEEPFEDLNQIQLITHVGRGSLRPELGETLTKPVKDLITKGWVEVPMLRPSIGELALEWDKIDKLVL